MLAVKRMAVLAGGVVAAAAMAAAAPGMSIVPVADSLVANSAPETNHGAMDRLITWTGYQAGWRGRSYIKFATAGLPEVSRVATATLNLYLFEGGGFVPVVDIHHVSDDTWVEMAVTWNNQPLPAPGAADLIISQTTDFVVGWKTFDLLSSGVWNYAGDLADGYASLLIKSPEVGDEAHSFYSREEAVPGDVGPYLRVTLLGDVQLDDGVNALDIGPFVERRTGGSYQAEADCNRDGAVDALDISRFVTLLVGGASSGGSAAPEPGQQDWQRSWG